MTNEEFIKYVTRRIKEYLPSDYADATVSASKIINPNDEKHTSLFVLRPQVAISQKHLGVALEPYAEQQRQGRDLTEIMYEIAENIVVQNKRPSVGLLDDIDDFSAIRPHLTTKLCDPDMCREYLEDKPWTPCGKWGLIYRIRLMPDDDNKMVHSVPVSYDLLKRWDIDESTLHEAAVDGEREKNPPLLVKARDVSAMSRMDSDNLRNSPINAYNSSEPLSLNAFTHLVLTKTDRLNGACVVGWDGVLQQVGEVVGRDFAVLPSSIHELLIYPDFGQFSYRGLADTVRRVNSNPRAIPPEDILSYKVHYYTRANKRLRHVSGE